MKVFVYPGSFDPVTNGHIDIVERASKLCDKIIVAVLVNMTKAPTFSIEERVGFLEESLKHIENVEVTSFSGLLIDFMKSKNANTIIKGLRAVSDFEYELQMASLNKKLDNEIETLFMMTAVNYSFLSSSLVRELAKFGGDISGLVPSGILNKICGKLEHLEK